MSLTLIRKAIAADLAAAVVGVKSCEPHPGRFDLTELKRIATRAPGVFVACLGIADADERGDGVSGTVSWAAFVVTRDAPSLSRDAAGLSIVQQVLQRVAGNRWERDESEGRPLGVRAQNLYSAAVDRQGVAMWGVSWSQVMNLGGAVNLAELDAFALYHAEHSMAEGDDEPAAVDNVFLTTE